jgi:hypothetical protein
MAPFLVCDPDIGATQFKVKVVDPSNMSTEYIVAAQADASAKFDLANFSIIGKYTFSMQAAGVEGWWSAASAPFPATKLASPGNLTLKDQ